MTAPVTDAMPHEPPLVYDPQSGEMVAPGTLRTLFDKTANAHDGDYPAKVGAGLMAVYAYGWRRGRVTKGNQK